MSTLNYNELREEFRRIALAEKTQKRTGNHITSSSDAISNSKPDIEAQKVSNMKARKQEFWEYLNSCPINN